VRSEARSWLALAVVLAAAAWIHAGALSAPFFADDYLFLDQVRGRSLPDALSRPDPLGNFLRPVSRPMWFWALSGASGESSRVFHIANLLLFLAILVLLHRVARRWLPPHAALAGVAVVAVHHAADVPLLWASGSQDLLAILGALIAFELHASGKRWWAGLALLAALFSKETVIFAPLLVAAGARKPRESWRETLARGWAPLSALPAWFLVWLATPNLRPAITEQVDVQPSGPAAALVHLLQTATGVEFPSHGPAGAFHGVPSPPFALALVGVFWLARAERTAAAAPRETSATARRSRAPFAIGLGLAWAILGAIPIAAVVHLWSAYYYLFSLCGMALVVGGCVALMPSWTAVIPVLVVGLASANTRQLPEFAITRDPWSTESHLNRHYFTRGMSLADQVLDDLLRARPTLPHRSTLYFAGLPRAIAFQAGDGPLVRWAYRDSSLRSFYLTRFDSAQASRGPVFFFSYRRDSLVEIQGADSLDRVALSLVLGDMPKPARDLLLLAWRTRPEIQTAYRLAWIEATREGLPSARPWLDRANVVADAGPAPEVPQALQLVARGDTARAVALMSGAVWRHGLDPGAHALLADLFLTTGQVEAGAIEAYATRALTPNDATAWRRWGFIQAVRQRDEEAVRSLERYLALAGIREDDDAEVARVLREMRRRVPGGDIAQAELGKTK
jgi:hypothetical protein